MNPLYPFDLSHDGELVLFRGTWPAERRALAAASSVTDDRSELEIVTKEAPRWKVATKPMPTADEGHRSYGLPSRESKIAWLEERAAKAERLAEEAAKTGTAAPVRPPVPSPAERRKAVDELLFGPVVADPVRDVIWGPRTAEPETEVKYAEPPLLHPRQAAIHGDAERAAMIEAPRRTVDEILFGARLRVD